MANDRVFHDGEEAAQERFGMRARLAQVGPHVIRDQMPDQHRELFEALPTLVVGSLDAAGRPWASLLFGRPGFLRSPDPFTLEVHASPVAGDPLAAHLADGASVGLLGLQPETRRRNRMNGVVRMLADGFAVEVRQSFGNCPKYIQARAPEWRADPVTFRATAPPRREGRLLSTAARALVAHADTFFVASAAAGVATAPDRAAHGVDVSHRGGRPGFVAIDDADGGTVLTVPDFVGNYLFNTVGNLLTNPRAGLLFVDFERGDLLGLTAAAEVIWDGPALAAFAGAERVLRFRVEEGWAADGAVPLRWSAPVPSPHLPGAGTPRA